MSSICSEQKMNVIRDGKHDLDIHWLCMPYKYISMEEMNLIQKFHDCLFLKPPCLKHLFLALPQMLGWKPAKWYCRISVLADQIKSFWQILPSMLNLSNSYSAVKCPNLVNSLLGKYLSLSMGICWHANSLDKISNKDKTPPN